MKADAIRIREWFGIMADAERRLRQLAEEPEEVFLADYRNTESAKYLLIVAIESAIDVCNHLVARSGGRAPEDYADCFAVLTTLGVIEPGLTQRLRQMARFRNLLVHLYWQVDDRRVYRALHEDLDDLSEYRRQIREWLGL